MTSIQKNLEEVMGPNFIKEYAKRVIKDWKTTLVELVSNSWDAYATEVKIILPEKVNDELIIEDNGYGLDREEFEKIWFKLRFEKADSLVKIPEEMKISRKIHGKYCIGRHSLFFLNSKYIVETIKYNKKNSYEIKLKPDNSFFDITHLHTKESSKNHGFIVKIKPKNLISPPNEDEVKDIIGTKFLGDPNFKIYINGSLINLFDLSTVKDKEEIETKYGNLQIYFFDSDFKTRTSSYHGIVWWVNSKLVGDYSWSSDYYNVDARYRGRKKITFLIIADFLKEHVKDDWSGFEKNPIVEDVHKVAFEYISKKLRLMFAKEYKKKKIKYFKRYYNEIQRLPRLSQEKIADFMERVQFECPHLSESNLEQILKILINLEESNYGYTLLDQLAKYKTDSLDDLTDLLNDWSIKDAQFVLTAIHRRIKIIKELEYFVNNKSDELHELQPLFDKALWMFGARYDSIQFTSNKSITTVVRKFFNPDYDETIRIRPDYVFLDNRSIAIYSTDEIDEETNMFENNRVVIIELKRGGFKIGMDEIKQTVKYAKAIIKTGTVPKDTEFHCFLLSTKIDRDYIDDKIKWGNIKVYLLIERIPRPLGRG